MRVIMVLVASMATAGCVTVPVVEPAANQKPLSVFSFGCRAPYELSQDCSSWMVANRRIRIEQAEALISGNADGRTVVVMDPHSWRNTILRNPLIFNAPQRTRASNAAFVAVREILANEGVRISRVVPIEGNGDVWGYVIEIDSDAYSILRKFSGSN
jgi:hypothetical protein